MIDADSQIETAHSRGGRLWVACALLVIAVNLTMSICAASPRTSEWFKTVTAETSKGAADPDAPADKGDVETPKVPAVVMRFIAGGYLGGLFLWGFVLLSRRVRAWLTLPVRQDAAPGLGPVEAVVLFAFVWSGVMLCISFILPRVGKDPSNTVRLISLALQSIPFLSVIVVSRIAASRRAVTETTAVVLPRARWGHTLQAIPAAALLYVPALIAAQFVTAVLVHTFEWGSMEGQQIINSMRGMRGSPMFPLFCVYVAVIGPVLEEALFRGVLYPGLRRQVGRTGAALLVSCAFALVHMNVAVFGLLFVLALILTWLYERTGGITAACVLHGIVNAVALIAISLGP